MMDPTAIVDGPLTIGRGGPFGGPVAEELAQHGYVLEEFIASGVARTFDLVSGAEARRDGRWETQAGSSAEYVTRFMVVRPADPERFNGVVLVDWMNVTAGVDLGSPSGREVWRGYAWVGVTCQQVAFTGRGGLPGLPAWDPERYGSLKHPGDPYSYDIFGQVARALRSGPLPEKVDPLGGLRPTALIAAGGSQSAARLASYINGAHQHQQIFDAFFPTVHWGVAMPPDESTPTITATGDIVGNFQIRDDQNVPIFVVNSETEVWSTFPVRQHDTDSFRWWEVAGGCHTGGATESLMEVLIRDGVALPGFLSGGDGTANSLDWSFVKDAALRHLVRWMNDGVAPPVFPLIEMDYGDPLTSVQRDELGLALGGVRLPEIDVPVAVQQGVNTTPNMLAKLTGERRVLPDDVLAKRYVDFAAYEAAYAEAASRLLDAGGVLEEDLTVLNRRGRLIGHEAGVGGIKSAGGATA
jgi:hypothetical protein